MAVVRLCRGGRRATADWDACDGSEAMGEDKVLPVSRETANVGRKVVDNEHHGLGQDSPVDQADEAGVKGAGGRLVSVNLSRTLLHLPR